MNKISTESSARSACGKAISGSRICMQFPGMSCLSIPLHYQRVIISLNTDAYDQLKAMEENMSIKQKFHQFPRETDGDSELVRLSES